MNITCQNCFHKWESKTNEKDKNFCHKCGYDNDKKIIDTEKLKNWIITNQKIVGENQINKIRSFIRKKLLKESNEQETRDFNIKNIGELYKDNATEIFKIIMSFPEIWLEEVGLETLLNFLEKEDSMNFRLQNGITTGNPIIFKSQEKKRDDESEIDYILRTNKINYTWKEIKNRLIQYFIQGIYRNVPSNKKIETKEDLINFLNTYKEAFLYGYIEVVAKTVQKKRL